MYKYIKKPRLLEVFLYNQKNNYLIITLFEIVALFEETFTK